MEAPEKKKKRPPRFIHWRTAPSSNFFPPAVCGARGGLMEERHPEEVTCPECLAALAVKKEA